MPEGRKRAEKMLPTSEFMREVKEKSLRERKPLSQENQKVHVKIITEICEKYEIEEESVRM